MRTGQREVLIGDDAGVRLIAAADDLGKAPLAGGEDPHVWLDPVRFAEMAEEAAAAMVESRPELAEEVDVNLARVRSDLATLDGELDLALFDCERDTIVTSHAAFGYFVDRYGLRQLAIAGLSPDAEPDRTDHGGDRCDRRVPRRHHRLLRGGAPAGPLRGGSRSPTRRRCSLVSRARGPLRPPRRRHPPRWTWRCPWHRAVGPRLGRAGTGGGR